MGLQPDDIFEFFEDLVDDLFDAVVASPAKFPDPARTAALDDVLSALGRKRMGRDRVEVELEGRQVYLRETVAEDSWLMGLRIPLGFTLEGKPAAWTWKGARTKEPKRRLLRKRAVPEREELVAVLGHKSVQKRLETLSRNRGKLVLHNDYVDIGVDRANRSAQKVARDIRAAVRLAKALEGVAMRPWRAAAKELGLKVGQGFELRGKRRGVAVRCLFERAPDPQTRIFAELAHPLPEGTQLAASLDSDVEIGDPILDPMVAIQTSDRPALSARLAKDEVRGPLLDWVRGLQGTVRADRVELILPGLVREELAPKIDAAAELAALL